MIKQKELNHIDTGMIKYMVFDYHNKRLDINNEKCLSKE